MSRRCFVRLYRDVKLKSPLWIRNDCCSQFHVYVFGFNFYKGNKDFYLVEGEQGPILEWSSTACVFATCQFSISTSSNFNPKWFSYFFGRQFIKGLLRHIHWPCLTILISFHVIHPLIKTQKWVNIVLFSSITRHHMRPWVMIHDSEVAAMLQLVSE